MNLLRIKFENGIPYAKYDGLLFQFKNDPPHRLAYPRDGYFTKLMSLLVELGIPFSVDNNHIRINNDDILYEEICPDCKKLEADCICKASETELPEPAVKVYVTNTGKLIQLIKDEPEDEVEEDFYWLYEVKNDILVGRNQETLNSEPYTLKEIKKLYFTEYLEEQRLLREEETKLEF